MPEQEVERLEHAKAAISNKVPLRAESLSQLPRLKLIAIAIHQHDFHADIWTER